jgi:hypothetical protein
MRGNQIGFGQCLRSSKELFNEAEGIGKFNDMDGEAILPDEPEQMTWREWTGSED